MSKERLMVTRWSGAAENHQRRYEWAAKYIQDRSVLDMGCGCGYGTAYLADQSPFSNITGVDVDQTALDFAAKYHARPGVEYEKSSLLHSKSSFDVIVCLETLEHVEDDLGFLSVLRRKRLNPGGLLLLSVPNEQYAPCNIFDYPFHIRHYTPAGLQGILSDAGFDVYKWYGQFGSEPGRCDVIAVDQPNCLSIMAVCRRAG